MKNPNVNPIFDRECDDPFVYCDLNDTGHSEFFKEAMFKLDCMFIPTQEDWHIAEDQRMFLERLGYKVDITYPFDDSFLKSGYMNAYDYWLYRVGLEEEWRGPWTTSKEEFPLPF